jgi:hypothetical protein
VTVDHDGGHAIDDGDRRHADQDGADAVKPVVDGGAIMWAIWRGRSRSVNDSDAPNASQAS